MFLTTPVIVWIKSGICTADSVINLALCLLGYIPGLIHAWYIILKYPEPDYDEVGYEPIYEPISGEPHQRRDLENGRVTYYYVSSQPLHPRAYGTVDPRAEESPAQSQHPSPKLSARPEGNAGGSREQAGDSRPPPTYAEAVRGDNKVQTQED